jgi:hypothetical protein
LQLAERRVGEPAGLCELADAERYIYEENGRRRQPEADGVHGRERDIAGTELQRHCKVHQSNHKWHGDEEDHDRAVRRENLIEMLGRQVTLCSADCDCLLRAHHDCVREAAQQHDQCQDDIHDADALMIDGGNPLAPEVGDVTLECDPRKDGDDGHDHDAYRAHDDRLIEGNRTPVQFAE